MLSSLALVACVLLLAHAFFRPFVSDGQRHPLLLCLLASPPLSLLSLTAPFLYLFGICPCTGSACSTDSPPSSPPLPSAALPTSTIVTVPASAVPDCDTRAPVCVISLPTTRSGAALAESSMQSQASATVVSGGLHSNLDAFPPSASPRSPVVQGHIVPIPSAGLCQRQTQSLEFVPEMKIDNRRELFFPCEA